MVKPSGLLYASLFLLGALADPRKSYWAKHLQGLGDGGVGTERRAAGATSDQTAALIAANMLVWSNNKYDAALGRFNVISIGQKDGDAPYNTKREALEAIEEVQRIVNANT